MATVFRCAECSKTLGRFENNFVVGGKYLCYSCNNILETTRVNPEAAFGLLVTTTPSLEGYKITEYIGFDSVEVVFGTGFNSEFSTAIQDALGSRSTAYENKMHSSKGIALLELKCKAIQKGANAIVGIDIDYTEFSSDRIGVVVNGTLVKIERVFINQEEALLSTF